ncbi:hypothetical protein [Pseudomonas tussilaginis]|uniref:hypothetical protein n=1 Tax=Pseudomonas putida TaxID=303 RepID=UPI002363D60F|nr:hypothetical protein [Pseudomonas putida]MDD1975220.1 hypothetical protein [Pseudomonas putida]
MSDEGGAARLSFLQFFHFRRRERKSNSLDASKLYRWKTGYSYGVWVVLEYQTGLEANEIKGAGHMGQLAVVTPLKIIRILCVG